MTIDRGLVTSAVKGLCHFADNIYVSRQDLSQGRAALPVLTDRGAGGYFIGKEGQYMNVAGTAGYSDDMYPNAGKKTRAETGKKESGYAHAMEESMREEEKSSVDVGGFREKTLGEYTKKELLEKIHEEKERIRDKVKNGDTETSFMIGGTAFTMREWDNLLEKFDDAQAELREAMQEEIAKRNHKKLKRYDESKSVMEENNGKTGSVGTVLGGEEEMPSADDLAPLTSESTVSIHMEEGKPEKRYITWYTEEGIFCREQGQTEGYYFTIPFERSAQYRNVLDFLNRQDKEADWSFASDEQFWKFFLSENKETV